MHLYLIAVGDNFTINTPGEILARANQTNASITTNTEVGTPTRIIEESALFQTEFHQPH